MMTNWTMTTTTRPSRLVWLTFVGIALTDFVVQAITGGDIRLVQGLLALILP